MVAVRSSVGVCFNIMPFCEVLVVRTFHYSLSTLNNSLRTLNFSPLFLIVSGIICTFVENFVTMKRLIIFACVALVGVSVLKADPVSDFLNRYELFVDGVAAMDKNTVNLGTMDSLKVVYKQLTTEYKTHKKQMTNIQLEKYYNLKAKYQKSVALIRTKKGVKAVKGWVNGVFGKKTKEE